jgi:CDGSH-type Zn-finger protein
MNKSKTSSKDQRIVISKDGPYLVYGCVPLRIQEIVTDQDGMSWDWETRKSFETENEYHLCRCGQSKKKPFCDGSHAQTGFDGEETASRIPYARQAEQFVGPTMVLSDAEDLCAFARFCDPGGKIWNLIEQTDDPEARDLVLRETMHCPAGRLVIHDKKTRQEIEDPLKPSIGIVEDPAIDCSGPLWIQGGIPIESADGKRYEIRNRVTLCRCGASDNKPFCNGSHASMKFHDGIMKDEQ